MGRSKKRSSRKGDAAKPLRSDVAASNKVSKHRSADATGERSNELPAEQSIKSGSLAAAATESGSLAAAATESGSLAAATESGSLATAATESGSLAAATAKKNEVFDASDKLAKSSSSPPKVITPYDRTTEKGLKVAEESFSQKLLKEFECFSGEDASSSDNDKSEIDMEDSLQEPEKNSEDTKDKNDYAPDKIELIRKLHDEEVFDEEQKTNKKDIICLAEIAEHQKNIAEEDGEHAEMETNFASDRTKWAEQQALLALKEAEKEVETALSAEAGAETVNLRKAGKQAITLMMVTEEVRESLLKFRELCSTLEGENESKVDNCDKMSTEDMNLVPLAVQALGIMLERVNIPIVQIEIEASRQRLLADRLVMTAQEQIRAATFQKAVVDLLLEQASAMKLKTAERMLKCASDLKALSEESKLDETELCSKIKPDGERSNKLFRVLQRREKTLQLKSRACEIQTFAGEEFDKARNKYEDCVERSKVIKQEISEIIERQTKLYTECAQLFEDLETKTQEICQ